MSSAIPMMPDHGIQAIASCLKSVEPAHWSWALFNHKLHFDLAIIILPISEDGCKHQ